MNKRVLFILLPVLAILFSFGKGSHVALPCAAPVFNVASASGQHDAAHSFNLTKDDSRINKNKVRIKAWDDYSAMDIADAWMPPATVFYFTAPAYAGYKAYALSLRLASYHLRGPPVHNA